LLHLPQIVLKLVQLSFWIILVQLLLTITTTITSIIDKPRSNTSIIIYKTIHKGFKCVGLVTMIVERKNN
jgi:hypothetical protein